MAGKRITVDHLAAIVAKGFQSVQEEFQALREETRESFRQVGLKLAEHSSILDEHTVRLGRIERKLDSTIARVDDHGLRLERLERKKQT